MDDFKTWEKITAIERAIQKMESPRFVQLSTRASLKLMNPQRKHYLNEAFGLAQDILDWGYLPCDETKEKYRQLINILIRMYKEKV